MKQFDRSFDENAGASMKLGSLVDKKTKIKSNYIDLSIDTENTDYIEIPFTVMLSPDSGCR